jgi:hypothetical protein
MRNLVLIALLAAVSAPTGSQDHVHQPGMTHPTTTLREPGQGAFAAISEVVAALMADPATDWSRVNINALREHLLDMDDVTLRSSVRTEEIPGGARFTVTGQGRTVEAIQRMTMAHAPMVPAPFKMDAQERGDGAVVTVTTSDAAGVARIRALGFYGVMTLGAHHQEHHLAIARGEMSPDHRHR